MPLGLFAWVLYVLWVILGGVVGWRGKDYYLGGAHILLVILVGVIMWRLFGPIVSG